MTTTHQPSTKQDILTHLLKRGRATAQELSESLKISPQATRRHLKDLEEEGLIGHETVSAGAGRPNYVYALSREGRDRFPDQHDQFAVSLLETLKETVGPDQMGAILQKQWERKALEYRAQVGDGALRDRVARLVELRRAEGYMAEFYPANVDGSPLETGGAGETLPDANQYILTEYNCAISQIAESYPSVCGHELDMFAVALNCPVERTHWLVDGEHRCGYLIGAAATDAKAP